MARTVERQAPVEREALLARCHGFRVVANGDVIGVVETPVFSGSSLGPDSLIVRTAERIPATFSTISVGAVERIDSGRRLISLVKGCAELGSADPR